VLEEDVYAEAIEAIVERDFFPHISKLQNQLDWLTAVQSGDPAAIKQAQLNIARRRAGLRTPLAHEGGGGSGRTPGTGLHGTPGTALLRTPAMTPAGAGGATPALGLRTPAGPAAAAALAAEAGLDPVTAQQQVGARAPGVGLDAFFAAYEGEDNASFQVLHEAALARKRLKVAHHLEDKNRPLLLAAGGHATDDYGTSGQAPSTVLSTRHRPKNALYYDASQQQPLALSAAERASIVAGPPKSISHSATRSLHEDAGEGSSGQQEQQEQEQQQQHAGASKAAAAGGAHGTRGYGYMRTPQIVPGVGASPIMTWGDIASTPLRLDGDAAAAHADLAGMGFDLGLGEYGEEDAAAAAAGRQFTLPEVRSREAKAQQMMAARAAAGRKPSAVVLAGARRSTASAATPLLNGLRRSTGAALGRQGPGAATPGGGTPQLSAAGMKLAQQLRRPGTGQRGSGGGGSSVLKGALDGDMQLRQSYLRAGGPTPSRTPAVAAAAGGASSGRHSTWERDTPQRVTRARADAGGAGGSGTGTAATAAAGRAITDDLLQLKR
jgi:protein DGCR14